VVLPAPEGAVTMKRVPAMVVVSGPVQRTGRGMGGGRRSRTAAEGSRRAGGSVLQPQALPEGAHSSATEEMVAFVPIPRVSGKDT